MPLSAADRERYRWAVRRIHGRCYTERTPARLLHVDLLLAPAATLRNIAKTPWAREHHGPGRCEVCRSILADPDTAATHAAQQQVFPYLQRYALPPPD